MSFLAAILGIIGIGPLQSVLERARPNQYAPRLPDQSVLSTWQGGGRLRGGLTGRTGSEADWADDQEAPGPASQADWGGTLGPGWFAANDPPRYFTGPVALIREPWGGDQRPRSPLVLPSTLNPPRAATPLPRDVQAAYQEANARRLGPTDIFEEE